MSKPIHPENENDPVLPECRSTVDLIQRMLDGETGVESLDADTHSLACLECRDRVRAARVLLSVLIAPHEPVVIPSDFAERIAQSMQKDRRVSTRRRVYTATAWLALAATILIAVYTLINPGKLPKTGIPTIPDEVAHQLAPASPKESNPAPKPQPIRIGDEVAKAGQTLLETPKPLADSVAVAPKLFDAITGPFKLSESTDPMTDALEPARKSLTELPVAARTGLEPVTGTAEKAYHRFLRDMGAVKPNL